MVEQLADKKMELEDKVSNIHYDLLARLKLLFRLNYWKKKYMN